ncbi:hypothetical protein FKX85_16400 [Echinicola soli]|uniref:Uncharacterized protein n=1 Tax=Echinicola soli TaxID=2591634 RepID=A0A514CL27_9BACT|nr:hypothetical protein [Echinicola soli]QDH80535.1 hypothetical protein FKX85_16400 [Echinicola soli]
MSKQKIIGFSGVMSALLMTCFVLLSGYFSTSVHDTYSKKDTVSVTTWSNFTPNAINLTEHDWSIGSSNVDQTRETNHFVGGFFCGLRILERQLLEQIFLCSKTAIPFGIREIIFPSHFFW